MTVPISDPQYWKRRRTEASRKGEPHRAVYDVDEDTWDRLTRIHDKIVRRHTRTGPVLRLNLGQGSHSTADWTELDLVPHLAGPCRLPFEDFRFRLAVAASIDGTVKSNLGFPTWRLIEQEILRVADQLILLSYGDPETYRMSDAVPDPEEHRRNTILAPGGFLVYRPAQDGTAEIYDLLVEEGQRKRGIGRRLVNELVDQTLGAVFGFTRETNREAQEFYRRCGFNLYPAPYLYRGESGVLFIKNR